MRFFFVALKNLPSLYIHERSFEMSEPEVVKLQAQLHKLQGQLNDVQKDRENLNKGTLLYIYYTLKG